LHLLLKKGPLTLSKFYKLSHSRRRIHSYQGGICGPRVGRAIGIDKQGHLKQEETYFKTLLADPRVKQGSSKSILTRAIADAIEFIESRERFWSQQV